MAIGLRCKDGVVLAVEKVQTSKLLVKGANKRIVSVDNHIGLVSVGFLISLIWEDGETTDQNVVLVVES